MNKHLFKAFYRKEEWAVKEVYEQYCRLLKHVSYQIVGDNDLADGIVNETFIRVLDKGELEDERTFIAYMCQVAHNLSIDAVKERNRIDSLPEDVAVNDEKNDDDVLTLLKKNLGKDEYDILILRAVLDYPFKDIAGMFDATTSSVRGIYHRCRKKAKELLEDLL